MTGINLKLGLVNVDVHVYKIWSDSVYYLIKISSDSFDYCRFPLKILSGNQIFTYSQINGKTEGQGESSIAPLKTIFSHQSGGFSPS